MVVSNATQGQCLVLMMQHLKIEVPAPNIEAARECARNIFKKSPVGKAATLSPARVICEPVSNWGCELKQTHEILLKRLEPLIATLPKQLQKELSQELPQISPLQLANFGRFYDRGLKDKIVTILVESLKFPFRDMEAVAAAIVVHKSSDQTYTFLFEEILSKRKASFSHPLYKEPQCLEKLYGFIFCIEDPSIKAKKFLDVFEEYKKLEDKPNALDALEEALLAARSVKDPVDSAYLLGLACRAYQGLGDLETALKVALEIPKIYCWSASNLENLSRESKKKSGRTKALSIAKEIGDEWRATRDALINTITAPRRVSFAPLPVALTPLEKIHARVMRNLQQLIQTLPEDLQQMCSEDLPEGKTLKGKVAEILEKSLKLPLKDMELLAAQIMLSQSPDKTYGAIFEGILLRRRINFSDAIYKEKACLEILDSMVCYIQDPAMKLQKLLEIFKEYEKLEGISASLVLLKKAAAIARTADESDRFKQLYAISERYQKLGDLPESLAIAMELGMDDYGPLNNVKIATRLEEVSRAYMKKGDFETALSIAEKLPDTVKMIRDRLISDIHKEQEKL